MRKEIVVCSAIKFDLIALKTTENDVLDFVLPMVRHYSPDSHTVLNQFEKQFQVVEKEQGFITNFGRFLTRKEALDLARKNNQVRFELDYQTDELFSEMLY